MGQSAKHIVTLSLVLQGIGCVATQHEFEQTAIRRTVLHLYEEQVMDNLIRVYNMRPIIQMRYSGITGEIKTSAGGSFGGSQEDAAGVITNMFDYNVEASRDNTLSVTANPILDGGSYKKQPKRTVDGHEIETYKFEESIYQRYVRFVWKLGPAVTDLITKQLEEETRRAIFEPKSAATRPESVDKLQAMLDERAEIERARKAPPQAQFRIPSLSEDLQAITAFELNMLIDDALTNKAITKRNAKDLRRLVAAGTLKPKKLKAWLDEKYRLLSRSRPEVKVAIPKPDDIVDLRLTGMLKCTPDEPRAYHEKKKYKGKYDDKAKWYWIPIKFRQQYFELAQSVTGGLGEAAQRGATSDGVLTELRLQRIRD